MSLKFSGKILVGAGMALILNLLVSVAVAVAPDTYIEKSQSIAIYGDWQVQCEFENKKQKSCVMMQKILAQSSKQELIQANIAKIENGTLMTLVFPLGIYLPAGIQIQVEDFAPYKFEIPFCTHEGCFVNAYLDKTLLDQLRKKESAKLLLHASADKVVDVPFSIKGFLDAYKALAIE